MPGIGCHFLVEKVTAAICPVLNLCAITAGRSSAYIYSSSRLRRPYCLVPMVRLALSLCQRQVV